MKKRIVKIIHGALVAVMVTSLAIPMFSEMVYAAENETSYTEDLAISDAAITEDPDEEDTVITGSANAFDETKAEDITSEEQEEVPDGQTESVDDEILSIDNAVISGIQDNPYTGKDITQGITVILNDRELIKDEDYTVSYDNNKNVGTAQIIIEGIGNYTGSVNESFEIYYPCSAPRISSVYSEDTGITITWESVKGASKYRVFRRTAKGNWEKICDTTSLQYVDKKVEFGKHYSYRIRCVDTSGSIYTSDNSSVGKGTTYTVDVGETSISHVYSDILSFKVRYTKVDHAAGYQVRYSLDPEMKNCVVKTFDSNEASLSVSKAPEGIYFVQARAYKADYAGNIIYGPWSHWKLAKCVKNDIGASEEVLEQHITKAVTNEAKMAVLYAFSRVGYPYSQLKRNTGDYYDCSSLAWYAWNFAGVNLTSDWVGTAAAEAQALQNKTISKSQLTPGSLIFFSSHANGRYKNITHVAMYVGDGMIVEAANSRIGVVYRQLNLNGRGTVIAYCDPGVKGGWYKESGQWVFYQSGIKKKNCWIMDSIGWCWLQENGNAARNAWLKINNAWYYFNNSGQMVKNSWVKDGIGWCWLMSDGRMAKSKWIQDHGYWYYLNAEGHMVTGKQTINGKQYRFDSSGRWIS